MRSVYKIIKNEDELWELIGYCKKTGYASVDFETTGLKFWSDSEYPTILGVSFQPGSSWIIPLGHKDSKFRKNYKRILTIFGREVIEDPNIAKICWNAKMEYKWFMKFGIRMLGRVFDVMLMKYLLDEEKPHGLKPMVDLYLPEFAGYALPGSNSDKYDWANAPFEPLCKYCGIDCDATFRLFLFFEPSLMKIGNFYQLFRNLLMMAVRTLSESEYMGMLVNREYLEGLDVKYKKLIEENEKALRDIPKIRKYQKVMREDRKTLLISQLKQEIKELKDDKPHLVAARKEKIARYQTGKFITKDELKVLEPINFGSPKQMVEFFYTNPEGLCLKVTKKTDSGQPSTDEETLLALKSKDKSGVIDGILKYRELEKLYSTYILGILEKLDPEQRIHTSYKIHGTVTGRLCIGGNSLLHTNKGLMPIKELADENRRGVYSVDTQEDLKVLTHTGHYEPIIYGINKGEEMMYEVELEDGKKIECTLGHMFLTDNGWVPLREIINNTTDYLIKTI